MPDYIADPKQVRVLGFALSTRTVYRTYEGFGIVTVTILSPYPNIAKTGYGSVSVGGVAGSIESNNYSYVGYGNVYLSSYVWSIWNNFEYPADPKQVSTSGFAFATFSQTYMSLSSIASKNEKLKLQRSIALNAKASLLLASSKAQDEDNFNYKYLISDTAAIPNPGVNTIIWYYYKEKNLEYGTTYNAPTILPSINNWNQGWNNIFTNALSPFGDGIQGLFPPDANGVASQTMNLSSKYLLANGDNGATTGGLISYINSATSAIGDSATNFSIITSGDSYGSPSSAISGATSYLYGGHVPTKLGHGVIGRRTQDIEITAGGGPTYYHFIIGNKIKDSPIFYSNSTDVNGYQGGEKTAMLNAIMTLLNAGDSNSSFQSHLRTLREYVRAINNNQNPLFLSANMSPDLVDTSIALDTYLTNLSTIFGNLGDGLVDATIWGYYNYFSTAVGNEVGFDTNIYAFNSLVASLIPVIQARANTIDDHTASTIIGTVTDKLRKWRYFWVNERIGKPSGSYQTYSGLQTAIATMSTQVTNAEGPLKILFGDTFYSHQKYIPTPRTLASFFNPLIDGSTGVITKRRTGFAFDGQQHASSYKIYRQPTPAYTVALTNADTQWNEATLYDIYTTIDSKTGFVSNVYTDNDPALTAGQKWVYRVRVVDVLNKVSGDTTASLQSSLFNTSTATVFYNSGDSNIHFGAAHNFKVGNYVMLQNSFNNGYYKVIFAGDTGIRLSPAPYATSGYIYLCSNVVFVG